MHHNPSQTAVFEIPEPSGDTEQASCLSFAHDINVERASFDRHGGYYLLGFHLLINGRWSMAFERANTDGCLVDEADSMICGHESQRLDSHDLKFIRTLIERRFFYDLQALEADHYWVNPD